MAVPTIQTSIVFDGNGSTSVPYPIPFPFLEPSHVRVAVLETEGGDWALLGPSAYSVVSGGVVTATDWPGTARVQVFRVTPQLQPIEFPVNGAFPAAANEEGLDRAIMIAQEMGRRLDEIQGIPSEGVVTVPGSGVELGNDVATWANAAARGAVVPRRVGQLGVQIDTDSVWIAQSTAVGDWQEFQPRGANMSSRLVIAFSADTGFPGDKQQALINLFTYWNPDIVALAGDLSYSAGAVGFNSDMAAFQDFIDAGKVYVVPGNHDNDEPAKMAAYAALFEYLPGNKRYYMQSFGDGLLDLFALHDGLNSAEVNTEPDGNTIGSVQHQWFAAAIRASTARWKIVMVHRPPTTGIAGSDRYNTLIDWPELALADGILCGHGHTSEHIAFRGIPLLNSSACVHPFQDNQSYQLQGALAPVATPLFLNSGARLAVRLTVTPARCFVEWVNVATWGVERAHDLSDMSTTPAAWSAAPFHYTDRLDPGDSFLAGRLPRAMRLHQVRVTTETAGTGTTVVELRSSGALRATITIPANSRIGNAYGLNAVMGEGSDITLNVVSVSGGYATAPFGARIDLTGIWVS